MYYLPLRIFVDERMPTMRRNNRANVNERLLYRLATSPQASRFVLKGAALSTVWTGQPHRPTRDLGLLGFGGARVGQPGPSYGPGLR